jgi:SAM-dependent methyltransferase
MKSVNFPYRHTLMWIGSFLGLGLAIAADNTNAPAGATAADEAPPVPLKAPDVIYVPTPQLVVDKMLEMADVKADDIVYDLGCGDGRIVVTAAKKYGVKAKGFDIDPQRVKEARENVRAAGVEHLVAIEQADVFTLDLRGASVITLYLLPELNVRLMPQLAQLRPGSRIVSHDFDMRGAKPVQVHHMVLDANSVAEDYDGENADHTIYKWVVPWETAVDPK